MGYTWLLNRCRDTPMEESSIMVTLISKAMMERINEVKDNNMVKVEMLWALGSLTDALKNLVRIERYNSSKQII